MNDVLWYGFKCLGISMIYFRSLLGFWYVIGGCFWGRDSSYYKVVFYLKGFILLGVVLFVVRIVFL